MIGLLFCLAAASAPLRGNAALDDIQHRAVTFFWEQSNPKTGYTKDRATNFDTNDTHTVASCAEAGADTFISGTGLFTHKNLKAAVAKMRKSAMAAAR